MEARKPDLTLISGDLLSRPSGEAKLRELVGRLPNAYAVLGNHDYAVTKDPFSRPVALDELGSARLLADEAETVEIRGRQVQIVGVDPRSYRRGTARPERLADTPPTSASCCVTSRRSSTGWSPASSISSCRATSTPGRSRCRTRAAASGSPTCGGRTSRGLYERPGGVLHLSAGLGTTFVPFRFFARPAAYELVLHSAG